MNIGIGIQEWLLSLLAAILPIYLIFASNSAEPLVEDAAVAVNRRRTAERGSSIRGFPKPGAAVPKGGFR